ncbi:DUF4037 domain-containing protein [Candidatus Daviesbacteria bacterium]|nr:DUF4037 domain-containing protein [Candidatus Daviesbacteria bacterium]
MDTKQKLIEIARRYADTITQEFTKVNKENIKLNIYISGSVSYGYCDEKSDIEIEFYLPDKIKKEFKDKLKKVIDEYPKFEDIRISAGVSDWPLEKIVHGDIDDFWNQSFPYLLYELAHATPIREDLPLINEVKNKLPFYPDNTLQKIIKGLWLTVGDNGTYNADWSFKRGQLTASEIFLFLSVEAILRLVYLLNKKYFPHTKWLEKELHTLDNDFGLIEFTQNIEKKSLEEKLEAHKQIVRKLDQFMSENDILRQDLINDPWSVVHEDYYVFNPMRFGWDELKH